MTAPTWKAPPADWRDDRTQKLFYRMIGDAVRIRRRAREWSQQALGDRVSLSGPAVGMIEAGRTRVTVFHLLRFATAFEVPVSDLLPPQ